LKTECIFELPFEVERFFVNSDGKQVTKNPIEFERLKDEYGTHTHNAIYFWLLDIRKRSSDQDDIDDIQFDIEISPNETNKKRKSEEKEKKMGDRNDVSMPWTELEEGLDNLEKELKRMIKSFGISAFSTSVVVKALK
jgi:hypothetical protein